MTSVNFHNESYMLRQITGPLAEGGLNYYYESRNPVGPVESGLKMQFAGVYMSVQTTPGTLYFAETMIVGGVIWPELDDMYRQNVRQWNTPEEVVDHLYQVFVSVLTIPSEYRARPGFGKKL